MYNVHRVKNNSAMPVVLEWNKSLLDREGREAYYAYKKSTDYLGVSPEEKAARIRKPEHLKALPFFSNYGKGVRFKVFIPQTDGTTMTTERYGMCIAPDWSLTAKLPINTLFELCDKFFIFTNKTETRDQLVSLLRDKIGDQNEVDLSDEPEVESGSSQFDNVKHLLEQSIEQRLKPGEITPVIVKEGFLSVVSSKPLSEVNINNTELSYKELQKLAKERGLPYVGVSEEKLRESLQR